MFKPEIKVLDCSIRDGGLINQWQFTDELVRATYRRLSEAGVDYMEIGYKASKSQFDPAEVRQVALLRRRGRPARHRRDRVGAQARLHGGHRPRRGGGHPAQGAVALLA